MDDDYKEIMKPLGDALRGVFGESEAAGYSLLASYANRTAQDNAILGFLLGILAAQTANTERLHEVECLLRRVYNVDNEIARLTTWKDAENHEQGVLGLSSFLQLGGKKASELCQYMLGLCDVKPSVRGRRSFDEIKNGPGVLIPVVEYIDGGLFHTLRPRRNKNASSNTKHTDVPKD